MALAYMNDNDLNLVIWFVSGVCKTKEFYEGMRQATEAGKQTRYRAEIVYFDDHATFEREFYTSIDKIRETLKAYRPYMPERTLFRCLSHQQTDIPQLLAFLSHNDKNIGQHVVMYEDMKAIAADLGVPLTKLEALLQRAASRPN